MKKSNLKLNITVVCLAVFFVVLAVFVTLNSSRVMLFMSGLREDFGGGAQGFQNITFTDAVVVCNATTEERYGERIRNLEVDNHSSRYDASAALYKIFLKMDLYDKKAINANLHFVNCFVRVSNGSIRKYDVFEDEGKKEKGIDTYDTNLFGMPKKK